MNNSGKITIIEGVDGAGKSVFAAKLYATFLAPAGLLHAGAPVSHTAMQEYVLPLKPALDGWRFVCDRWHLGEPVWAPIFGRQPLFSFKDMFIVEENLMNLTDDITAIYLERDLNGLLQEQELRGDDQLDIKQALDLYEQALAASSFNWYRMTLPEAEAEYL